MSYILDALKKAAEQRGASAAVLLRPSAPLARVGRWGRLPWIIVGALLLLNIAGLVYLWRPVSMVTPAPAPVPPARVALIQPIEPAPPPAPTQVIPAEPPRAPATSPTAPPRIVIDKPVGGKPVARVVPDVPAAARPGPADPKAAVAPPAKADGQRFKLEVLSYSDVPAQRLVFINGRRYREGETMDGGAKVEEIREDSVILSEAGQRFTLR